MRLEMATAEPGPVTLRCKLFRRAKAGSGGRTVQGRHEILKLGLAQRRLRLRCGQLVGRRGERRLVSADVGFSGIEGRPRLGRPLDGVVEVLGAALSVEVGA